MKELDVVELLFDLEKEGLTKGQRGTILEVYDDKYCEVEFCDDNGRTLFLGALLKDNFVV